MSRNIFFHNLKYFFIYQLIFVLLFVMLSSIGAFFHFLLDHEIGIVESWLHSNHWEIIILSKVLALNILSRWFQMRLYQLTTLKEFIRSKLEWPDSKTLVVTFFMLLGYLYFYGVVYVGGNFVYWYFHLISYLGLFFFFALDFLVMGYLIGLQVIKEKRPTFWRGIFYLMFFSLAFRITVPDYYRLFPYVISCYLTLLYLSGSLFQKLSNVFCFSLFFIAPMGALFGLDPVWGTDFSPLKLETSPRVTFLLMIGVISFGYYKTRDQIGIGLRKFIR